MPGLEVPRYSPVSRHDFPISEMEAWLQSWLAWIRSEKGTLSEYNQQARPMGCVLPVVAHGGGGGGGGRAGNNMDPLSSPEIKLPEIEFESSLGFKRNPKPPGERQPRSPA